MFIQEINHLGMQTEKLANDEHPLIKTLRPNENEKMAQLANMYGSFLPMQLTIERAFLRNVHMHAGIPSSYHGLMLATGRTERVGFGDIFSQPQMSEKMNRKPLWMRMEEQL